jgi:hypothetical protein
MKTRGMGHVEVILAFVLFVSAVVFILQFIDIKNDTNAGEATLAFVSRLIKTEAETSITRYSIILNKTELGKQGEPLTVTILLPEAIPEGYGLRAEAVVAGQPLKLASKKHETDKSKVIVERDKKETQVLRLIIGPEINVLEASNLGTPANNPNLYTLSLLPETKIFAETKLQTMQESYMRDYQAFKKARGIGERTNLQFEVRWKNPEIIVPNPETQILEPKQDFIKAQRAIHSRVDVTANTQRLELLLKDGQLVFADVTIQTW